MARVGLVSTNHQHHYVVRSPVIPLGKKNIPTRLFEKLFAQQACLFSSSSTHPQQHAALLWPGMNVKCVVSYWLCPSIFFFYVEMRSLNTSFQAKDGIGENTHNSFTSLLDRIFFFFDSLIRHNLAESYGSSQANRDFFLNVLIVLIVLRCSECQDFDRSWIVAKKDAIAVFGRSMMCMNAKTFFMSFCGDSFLTKSWKWISCFERNFLRCAKVRCL